MPKRYRAAFSAIACIIATVICTTHGSHLMRAADAVGATGASPISTSPAHLAAVSTSTQPSPLPHADVNPSAPAGSPTGDADKDEISQNVDWKRIAETIGTGGTLADGVYHINLPRADLDVTVEGMPVPTGAGIASDLYFWRCRCGKLVTRGSFCVVEYEANDVVDALRTGGVHVTGIDNFLVSEHPKLLLVHFYAEGTGYTLGDTMKAALDCTGESRLGKKK